MATSKTNDQDFKADVLESDKFVLVDFWAEWCAPCKAIAPTLEEISEEMKDKLKVVKVNVDENPTVFNNYNLRGIPALLMFKNGEKVSEKIGSHPKSALQAWVNETL
jgi:thioredoxin 1